MPTTTRKNVPAVSSDLGPIAGNVKYVGKAPTANLAAFAEFVLADESTPKFRTAAERTAFRDGIRLAGLRSRFETDRRTGTIDPTVTFVEYAIATSGYEVKSDAERAAVSAGISASSLYRKYQISKRATVDATDAE